jgi:hypothetical protein
MEDRPYRRYRQKDLSPANWAFGRAYRTSEGGIARAISSSKGPVGWAQILLAIAPVRSVFHQSRVRRKPPAHLANGEHREIWHPVSTTKSSRDMTRCTDTAPRPSIRLTGSRHLVRSALMEDRPCSPFARWAGGLRLTKTARARSTLRLPSPIMRTRIFTQGIIAAVHTITPFGSSCLSVQSYLGVFVFVHSGQWDLSNGESRFSLVSSPDGGIAPKMCPPA